MTGAHPEPSNVYSPAAQLGATVAGTAVALGLTTGGGPLVEPLGDGYQVSSAAVSLVVAVM